MAQIICQECLLAFSLPPFLPPSLPPPSVQQNSGLNSQLLAASKQVAELQDGNAALKSDLRRAKEALKSPQDSRQLMEKVKELEGENMELQRAMQVSACVTGIYMCVLLSAGQ